MSRFVQATPATRSSLAAIVRGVAAGLGLTLAALLGSGSPASAATVATPIGTYPTAYGLTASGRNYAFVLGGENGDPDTLYVGSGDGQPAPAAGASELDGLPHFGTSRAGHVVITYPRCRKATTSCSLYVWDLASRREHKVAGLGASGTDRLEGAMQRGNVALMRSRSASQPTQLLYKPVGGRLRVVLAKNVGQNLALHGRTILQTREVSDDYPERDPQGCGVDAVEQITLSGKAHLVKIAGCGEAHHFIAGAGFVAGSIQVAAGSTTATSLYRFPVSGKNSKGKTPGLETAVAFATSSTAYSFRDHDEDGVLLPTQLIRLTQLTFDDPLIG